MNMKITVVQIGTGHVAMTTLGGIRLRGRRADTALLAVQNLCWKLAGQDNDDETQMGLELELEHRTLNVELGQLTNGDNAS